jgi:hypothetical protein
MFYYYIYRKTLTKQTLHQQGLFLFVMEIKLSAP